MVLHVRLNLLFQIDSLELQIILLLLKSTITLQELKIQFVEIALSRPDCGFTRFERVLINRMFKTALVYDEFFIDWSKANFRTPAEKKLTEDLAAGVTIPSELYHFGTIIQLDDNGNYYHESWASHFKNSIPKLLAAYDEFIADLEGVRHRSTPNAFFSLTVARRHLLESPKRKFIWISSAIGVTASPRRTSQSSRATMLSSTSSGWI